MRVKTFSKILISILLMGGAFSFLILPRLVFGAPETPASPPVDVLANLEQAGSGTGLVGQGGPAGEAEITTIIVRVIQIALDFVGVIFLILMVYAGFLWMMARGNEQRVEKAKTLIEAAVIGIVIVLAAYGISVFVVERLLGVGGGGGGGCPSGQMACTCPAGQTPSVPCISSTGSLDECGCH